MKKKYKVLMEPLGDLFLYRFHGRWTLAAIDIVAMQSLTLHTKFPRILAICDVPFSKIPGAERSNVAGLWVCVRPELRLRDFEIVEM